MLSLGYLRQAPDSKRYFIGTRLFFLAASARSEVQIIGIAEPTMRQLALSSGNTAVFGMRAEDEIVIVSKAEGNEAFQISSKVRGASRPHHCTAMGKIILADMPAPKLEAFLAAYELKAFTANTITDRRRLVEAVAEVRRSGLAFDDAEFHPEMRCIAAPVRNFTNQVIGALAMSGPAWRMSLQSLHGRSSLLRQAADDLSAQLGYRSDLVGAPLRDARITADLLPE
jgi:DNA-binding IclR family transcriptional regulator